MFSICFWTTPKHSRFLWRRRHVVRKWRNKIANEKQFSIFSDNTEAFIFCEDVDMWSGSGADKLQITSSLQDIFQVLGSQNLDFWLCWKPGATKWDSFSAVGAFLWFLWFRGRSRREILVTFWNRIAAVTKFQQCCFCDVFRVLVFFVFFWFRVPWGSIVAPILLENGPWNQQNSNFCEKMVFVTSLAPNACFWSPRRPDSYPKIR